MSLLLVVTRLDNPILGDINLDELEPIFGAATHAVCEDNDCINELANKACGILYLEGFYTSRQTIEKMAASKWSSPPVVSVRKTEAGYQVSHGSHTEKCSSLSLGINTLLHNARKKVGAMRSAYLCFVAVALMILAIVHLTMATHENVMAAPPHPVSESHE